MQAVRAPAAIGAGMIYFFFGLGIGFLCGMLVEKEILFSRIFK